MTIKVGNGPHKPQYNIAKGRHVLNIHVAEGAKICAGGSIEWPGEDGKYFLYTTGFFQRYNCIEITDQIDAAFELMIGGELFD